jgi:hypothetical protein
MGWVVNATPRPLYPGKDAVPSVWEVGWGPEPVWTGAENLAPTGILSPDRPARSESLYRLRYPAHDFGNIPKKKRVFHTRQYILMHNSSISHPSLAKTCNRNRTVSCSAQHFPCGCLLCLYRCTTDYTSPPIRPTPLVMS